MKIIAVAAAVALLMGGCATREYGRQFDVSKASEIRSGVTTKQQVQALLGAPMYRNKVDGKEYWTYFQSSYTAGSAKGAAKTAATSIAGAALGMIVPGAGIIAMAGASVTGVSGNPATEMSQSSRSLLVTFHGDVVQSCTFSSSALGTDSTGTYDSETRSCS